MPTLIVTFTNGPLIIGTTEHAVWNKAHADHIISSCEQIGKLIREEQEERSQAIHSGFHRLGPYRVRSRLYHAPIFDEL